MTCTVVVESKSGEIRGVGEPCWGLDEAWGGVETCQTERGQEWGGEMPECREPGCEDVCTVGAKINLGPLVCVRAKGRDERYKGCGVFIMGACERKVEGESAGVSEANFETREDTGVVEGFAFEICEVYEKCVP